MKTTLSVTIFLSSLILLSGCQIPSPGGSKVMSGNPVGEKEQELVLEKGVHRDAIIEALGEPSWMALGEDLLCYEGTYFHGRHFRTENMLGLVVLSIGGLPVQYLATLASPYEGDGPQLDRIEESRRLLIHFDASGKADYFLVYSDPGDYLQHTRLVHLFAFLQETGLGGSHANQEFLESVYGGAPDWQSEDGRFVFLGEIREELGNINGVFLEVDSSGRVLDVQRQHFGNMTRYSAFRRQLPEMMEAKCAELFPSNDRDVVIAGI